MPAAQGAGRLPHTKKLAPGTVQTVTYRGANGRYVLKTLGHMQEMEEHMRAMLTGGWAIIDSRRLAGQVKITYRKAGPANDKEHTPSHE